MNKNEETLEIYTSITHKLYNEWETLYQKGGVYNLSPYWCKTWLKYFGKEENIKIITIWHQNEIQLLAPFYIRKNKLTLIGTKPDLYDEFNVLYSHKKYLSKLINYIIKNNYQINFRHLDTESELSKQLIKYISGKAVNQQSHVDETKLYIKKDNYKASSSFRTDVRRCKKNLTKDTEDEYKFELKAKKTETLINEFVKFHTTRWGGGMLAGDSDTVKFIKEIIKDDNLTVFSRLYLKNSNETAAIAIGYIDSNNKYTYSLPTYNNNFRKYSPGKVFLSELIDATFENGIENFDMGRGSEPYKSWVTDEQSLLYSITTNNNPKYYKIQRFISKVMNLIFY